jgi:CheY-like chemotaxis protein
MVPDIASRAFEPFFTTKPTGAGTGLGLSMVYGFAKQSGGQARICSEPGHGTTVRLYLPRYRGSVQREPAAARVEAETLRPGTSTILVVDDEPVLRMLVCEVLREQGFSVLEASDGPEALDLLGRGQAVDLLITDVGLPGGLNGRQVADAIRTRRPGIKVLFITGYAENAALGGGMMEPNTQVLTKPFEMRALRAKVRGMVA